MRIALVGEVRGEIEPCGCPTLPFGGFARRANLLDQLRKDAGGPLFQLDAGELLIKGQTTRATDPERVRLLLDLQDEVGVDVWAPGPTDLGALGVEGLRERAKRKEGPRLVGASWLDASGAPVLPMSAVIERDGLRLGVIGLAGAPTSAKGRAEVSTRDPRDAALAALATLPADLDLIVALGSVPDAVADQIAQEVPGISAVLTTRGASFEDPRTPPGGGATIVEAPDRGRYIELLHLDLGTGPAWPLLLQPDAHDWRDLAGLLRTSSDDPAIVSKREALQRRLADLEQGRNLAFAEAIPLGAQYDGDNAVEERLKRWKHDAQAEAEEVAARPPTPSEHGYAGSGACVNCHTTEFARWAFTGHAKAWDALVLRKETSNPECVSCHTTGYAQPGGLGQLTPAALRMYKGVQCESCHGPLLGHPDDDKVEAKPVAESTCRVCHDEANSPQFDYKPYLQRATCQGGAPDQPALGTTGVKPPSSGD